MRLITSDKSIISFTEFSLDIASIDSDLSIAVDISEALPISVSVTISTSTGFSVFNVDGKINGWFVT